MGGGVAGVLTDCPMLTLTLTLTLGQFSPPLQRLVLSDGAAPIPDCYQILC